MLRFADVELGLLGVDLLLALILTFGLIIKHALMGFVTSIQLFLLCLYLFGQVNCMAVVLDDCLFSIELHSLMFVALLDNLLEVFSALVQLLRSEVENLLLLILVSEAELLHECLLSEVICYFYIERQG